MGMKMNNNSFLQRCRRDNGYENANVRTCEKFSRYYGVNEYFIKCDADTKTFQRCYTEHKD